MPDLSNRMHDVTEWVTGLFPQGGYFLEAGAHDGIGDSQTKQLEDLGGWRGICVEPSSAFAGLKKYREGDKCKVDNRCLYNTDGGEVLFRQVSGNSIELSGIQDSFQDDHWDRVTRPHKDLIKTTVTLPTLLKEYKAPPLIEFFSLDTEGSEYLILSCHDFSRWRFVAIQVEHNGVASHRKNLTDLLTRFDYELKSSDGVNDRWLWKGFVNP